MRDLLAFDKGDAGTSSSLVQVWLPSRGGDGDAPGQEVLATRGAPFTVAGNSGDALAAFRSASTHYEFSAPSAAAPGAPPLAPSQGSALPVGMPGRVFSTGRAEITPDVQLYSQSEYARLPDAVRAGIRGTLALPVFDMAGTPPASGGAMPAQLGGSPSRPVAVLEFATPSHDVEWQHVIARIRGVLEHSRLSTSSSARVNIPQEVVLSQPGLGPQSQAALTYLVHVASAWPGIAFAQVWRLCTTAAHTSPTSSTSSGAYPGGGAAPPPPGVEYLHTWAMPHTSVTPGGPSLAAFRVMCCETPLVLGQGLPGVAVSRGTAEWTGTANDAFDIAAYPLRHFAFSAGLVSGAALRLELPEGGGETGGVVVLECLSTTKAGTASDARHLLTSFQSLLVELAMRAKAAALRPSLVGRKRGPEVGPFAVVAPPLGDDDAPGGSSNDDDDGDEDGDEEEGGLGKPQKRSLSREDLVAHFAHGLPEASKRLGMCATTLKRICRTHGVARWPSRKKWREVLQPLALAGPNGVDAVLAALTQGGGAAPQQPPVRKSLDGAGRGAGVAAAARQTAGPPPPLPGAPLPWDAGQRDAQRGSSSGNSLPSEMPSDMALLGAWDTMFTSMPVPVPGAMAFAPGAAGRGGAHQVLAVPAIHSPDGQDYLQRVFAGGIHPGAAARPWSAAFPNGAPQPPAVPPGVPVASVFVAPPPLPAAAPAAPRFCFSCGSPLAVTGASFCHMCGVRVTGPA